MKLQGRPRELPYTQPMSNEVAWAAFRLATEGDIPELRRLIEASVRGLQREDYTAAQIEGALGHALGLDTQLVADRTYFVVVAPSSGQILGCGGWSFRKTLFGGDGGPGRVGEVLDPARDRAKIRAIFIHPEWARRGLGSRILRHCEEAAWAAGFRQVEMGATLTGVPLYQRQGYVALTSVSVPLPNGEVLPMVHMMRRLHRDGETVFSVEE